MAAGVASDAGAVAERKLAAAHQAMLHTRGLQFDFKTYTPPKPPGWVQALAEFLAQSAPVLKYVFWAGLVLAAVLFAWFILREVMDVRFARPGRTAFRGANLQPTPDRAKALLEEADRLAAEGRFEAAIHVLLYRSIDDISGRRPGTVRPALTSRDIAGLAAMPEAARHAFARLTEAVERSFFGGRAVGADEFGAARADYQAFAFSEGWR